MLNENAASVIHSNQTRPNTRTSTLQLENLLNQAGKDRSTPAMKQERDIFLRVLLYGFIIQMAARAASVESVDQSMWAKQIQYLLTHDPRVFDFYAAYGHPGTTLVELGSLFHILFGFSYSTALTLGMSILIAVVTAACSVLCFLLYRQSLWWLATAFLLLLNRMYMNATPPTAVVMPFTVLIVLATWWLWEQQGRTSRWPYFLWGAVAGLAAATRLDASLLVSTPMFVLLWYRHGRRVVLPLLAGAGISFFMADPFLWFMPIRHVTDLVHKFTMHYVYYSPTKMEPSEFINAMWMSTVSFGWSFVLLFYQRRVRNNPNPDPDRIFQHFRSGRHDCSFLQISGCTVSLPVDHRLGSFPAFVCS